MAYINFNLLTEKGYDYIDALVLQMCKQMKFEDISQHLMALSNYEVEFLLRYEDIGLVTFIKGSPKDNMFQKARLTKEGQKLLDSLEVASITEEDEKIWDWLAAYYKKIGKQVGNTKKGKRYLAQFRLDSGINRNKLVYLCKSFIDDESRMEYSIVLEYVFFKPFNVYSTRFSLEDSKLWKYYLEHKDTFDEEFKKEKYSK